MALSWLDGGWGGAGVEENTELLYNWEDWSCNWDESRLNWGGGKCRADEEVGACEGGPPDGSWDPL